MWKDKLTYTNEKQKVTSKSKQNKTNKTKQTNNKQRNKTQPFQTVKSFVNSFLSYSNSSGNGIVLFIM